MGEVILRDASDLLKVVVTQVTEVGRPEAEEHCHGTTVSTLVLQEVCTMLWTHLKKNIDIYRVSLLSYQTTRIMSCLYLSCNNLN